MSPNWYADQYIIMLISVEICWLINQCGDKDTRPRARGRRSVCDTNCSKSAPSKSNFLESIRCPGGDTYLPARQRDILPLLMLLAPPCREQTSLTSNAEKRATRGGLQMEYGGTICCDSKYPQNFELTLTHAAFTGFFTSLFFDHRHRRETWPGISSALFYESALR